jgi:hypothetical protein
MELKEKTMLKRMMGKLLKTKLQPMGNRLSVAWLGLVAAPVFCAGLNDTGINYCSNNSSNNVACSTVAPDNGTHPRQDGRFGRDAQGGAGKLAKIGGGGSGFDFSKIGNNGTVLAANAVQGSNPNDWACTRDNITGLVWEVKTTSGLDNQSDTFSWYSSDSTSNGGLAGSLNNGRCSISSCDTKNFVDAVNFAGLCGATNWRLPTVKELEGLSDFGRGSTAPTPGPTIDPTYFPNTPSVAFWSSTATAINGTAAPSYAWAVNTRDGIVSVVLKSSARSLRLVRSGF